MQIKSVRIRAFELLRLIPAVSVVSVALLDFVATECRASGHGHSASSHEDEEEAEEDGDHPRERGIELGEFEVRSSRAVPPQKNLVHFKLHLTASGERFKQLRGLLHSRKNKVRDQVIIATRLVEIESYDDPELTGLHGEFFCGSAARCPSCRLTTSTSVTSQLLYKTLSYV